MGCELTIAVGALGRLLLVDADRDEESCDRRRDGGGGGGRVDRSAKVKGGGGRGKTDLERRGKGGGCLSRQCTLSTVAVHLLLRPEGVGGGKHDGWRTTPTERATNNKERTSSTCILATTLHSDSIIDKKLHCTARNSIIAIKRHSILHPLSVFPSLEIGHAHEKPRTLRVAIWRLICDQRFLTSL